MHMVHARDFSFRIQTLPHVVVARAATHTQLSTGRLHGPMHGTGGPIVTFYKPPVEFHPNPLASAATTVAVQIVVFMQKTAEKVQQRFEHVKRRRTAASPLMEWGLYSRGTFVHPGGVGVGGGVHPRTRAQRGRGGLEGAGGVLRMPQPRRSGRRLVWYLGGGQRMGSAAGIRCSRVGSPYSQRRAEYSQRVEGSSCPLAPVASGAKRRSRRALGRPARRFR